MNFLFRPRTLLPALLTACLASPFAFAQTPQDHAPVARFLDSETLAVAWVDIGKADIAKTLQFTSEVFGEGSSPSKEDLDRIAQSIGAVRDALVSLKVERIYALVERGTMKGTPECFIIPCSNPAPVKALVQSILNPQRHSLEVLGNTIVAGHKDQVAEIVKQNGPASSELTAALANHSGIHGLIALTPIDVTLPLLSSTGFKHVFGNKKDLVAAATRALAGIQSLSLNTELPPKQPSLRFKTQSESIAREVKEMLASLAANAQAVEINSSGTEAILRINSTEGTVALLQSIRKQASSDPTLAVNNLKQIALALHNYHDVNGAFPPQAITDKDGKKLLSWRVLILPYLEQQALFNAFKLDEPWDSPHNLPLSQSIVPSYSDPLVRPKMPNGTRFLAPLSEKSLFGRPGKPTRITDITDGTSNTIFCLQVPPENAVPWAKPEDAVLVTPADFAKLYPIDSGRILAGWADGSVRSLPEEAMRKMFGPLTTINGGEVVNYNELK